MVQVGLEKLETTNSGFSIGCRVADGSFRGTVLYIGPVSPHDGLWLGIDWDDVSRGKHDGMYNNVRYFTARCQSSGSFVRPGKVQHGCSFMEAVKEKYAPSNPNQMDVILVGGSKPIEFVGMDKVSAKQSKLELLRNIVLDDSLVNHAGDDPITIATYLPNAIELHLCNTLISDWREVYNVCRHMTKLVYLNLSLNVFVPLDSKCAVNPLVNVRSLILTGCRLAWNDANTLAALFPNLVELGLCRNQITQIESISFEYLESLDLEGNAIARLENVWPLSSLKSLQVLNLSNTGLVDFLFPATSDTNAVPFRSLKALYLSNNALAKWETVNEMNRLPSLEHLLIHGNPVMTIESLATSRQLVIARIKNLKTLDRQTIETQERTGAEIDYLSKALTERNDARMEDFTKAHPRYDELCRIYGAPEKADISSNSGGLLKNRIITLNIELPDGKKMARKVPSSVTVQKLKALIGRACSVDIRQLQLSYESCSRRGVIVPLDNDLRDLVFYSLASDDRILTDVSAT